MRLAVSTTTSACLPFGGPAPSSVSPSLPYSLPVLVSGAAEAAVAAVPAAVASAAIPTAPAPRLAPALHGGGGGGGGGYPTHTPGVQENVAVSTTLLARHPHPTHMEVDGGV